MNTCLAPSKATESILWATVAECARELLTRVDSEGQSLLRSRGNRGPDIRAEIGISIARDPTVGPVLTVEANTMDDLVDCPVRFSLNLSEESFKLIADRHAAEVKTTRLTLGLHRNNLLVRAARQIQHFGGITSIFRHIDVPQCKEFTLLTEQIGGWRETFNKRRGFCL